MVIFGWISYFSRLVFFYQDLQVTLPWNMNFLFFFDKSNFSRAFQTFHKKHSYIEVLQLMFDFQYRILPTIYFMLFLNYECEGLGLSV